MNAGLQTVLLVLYALLVGLCVASAHARGPRRR